MRSVQVTVSCCSLLHRVKPSHRAWTTALLQLVDEHTVQALERSAIFLAICFFISFLQWRVSHSTPPAALLPPAGRDLEQAKNSRRIFIRGVSDWHQSVLVAVLASRLFAIFGSTYTWNARRWFERS